MAQHAGAGRQRAARADASARPRRRHRGGRPGARRSRRGCRRPIWSKSPRPRARRICSPSPAATASARRSPTCWSAAATPKSCATSPTTRPPSCRRAASPRWSSARKATASWPRRSASGRTFRRICSAICWCARPRWCSSACSRRPSRRPKPKSSACSTRSRKEFGDSAPARDYAAAQRAVARAAQDGKLDEAELADFAKDKKFEETVAALSLLCGVPIEIADRLMARRPARPDPDPLQGGRLRLDHRARDHHGAPERQGHLDAGARRGLRQFRAAVAVDRAARGAVLAGRASPKATSAT